MVNSVVNSISQALYATFGSSYHYYVDDVEQGSKLPCFNIGVLNPQFRSINRKDYKWTVPCVLHFFTDDKTNTNKTCYSIGQQVLECLEYLNIDSQLVRGEDMSFDMVDDVLQVFVTYRFWTEKPETLINMEDLATVETSVN